MKQFFKMMLASMVGFSIVTFIIIILVMGLISSMISYTEKEVINIKENSVLYINLNKEINDRTTNNPISTIDYFSLKPQKNFGLNDILYNLKKAKNDPKIKGIYLELSAVSAGVSTLQEIRDALVDFKESGKFIISFSEYMSQGAYFLASVSDKIYHSPEGIFLFKGLSAQVTYYKPLMDKLKLEAQVIKHGDYKSAVEPYLKDKMSAENRVQTENYLSDVWTQMLTQIANDRGTSMELLNEAANGLIVQDLKKALEYQLIDQLAYRDEAHNDIRDLVGLSHNAKISFIGIEKYNSTAKTIEPTRDRIAVIYAYGTIMGGEGSDQSVGSARLSKAIRDARKNKRVKAIVLRVNSGGGDVIASEAIRREVSLAAQIKPVVASFGDYAASGGYWISCDATKIMASPVSLTGSIGVYAIFPNLGGFLNDKIGITFDQVNTNKYSDFYTGTKALSSYEKAVLTKSVENTYDRFLTLVSEGRGMQKEEVNQIAGGHIWSGEDARKNGLIDEFGGLSDAINAAAELAEIEQFRILELPIQKDPFQELLETITGNAKVSIIDLEFSEFSKYIKPLKSITEMKGIQVRLPFEMRIE